MKSFQKLGKIANCKHFSMKKYIATLLFQRIREVPLKKKIKLPPKEAADGSFTVSMNLFINWIIISHASILILGRVRHEFPFAHTPTYIRSNQDNLSDLLNQLPTCFVSFPLLAKVLNFFELFKVKLSLFFKRISVDLSSNARIIVFVVLLRRVGRIEHGLAVFDT